ncbi:MAG: helix-turn-helix domain-containing protein [Lachnospiraceae bacterium]|nr:helix-turn-helix domain-containing protein [Lachnospiraceae bacterium]
MDENILGKNIKYLREMYGDTQEELGLFLGVQKNTISGYERGQRQPDSEKLGQIARRYDKTTDELLNTNLFELGKINTDNVFDCDKIWKYALQLFPLVESPKAYKNVFFSKGMRSIKKVFNSYEDSENGALLIDAMENFQEAAMADILEAYVNLLSCIFLLRKSVQADPVFSKKFQSRIISKQVNWKEMIYETRKNERKVAKMEGMGDLDELSLVLIKELKNTKEWAQIGDYYLAVRYIFSMVDTGESDAMNIAVGMQMMISFAQLGNKYAIDYIRIGNEVE